MQNSRNNRIRIQSKTDARLLSVLALFLTLLLTRLRLHGVHAPFALGALFGAAFAGLEPAWAALGVLIGSLIGEPVWESAACAVLLVPVLRFARYCSSKRRPVVDLLLMLGCLLLSLPLSLSYGLGELWYGLFGVLVAFAAAAIFYHGFGLLSGLKNVRLLTEWDQDALLICVGLCILSLSEIETQGVSLSMILILFLTMLLTAVRGLYGTFAATLLSVAWVLYAKADARIVALVTLGAALSIPFCHEGRGWIAAAHLVAGLLLYAVRRDPLPMTGLLNTVFASVLLIAIPKKALRALEERIAVDRTLERSARSALSHAKRRTARELYEMGKLLCDVSETFAVEDGGEAGAAAWTVQGALSICTNCPRAETCWRNAETMREAVLALAARLEDAQSGIPTPPIPSDCPHFSELCASVLLAYQQAIVRDTASMRMQRQNDFSTRAFLGAGEAIGRLADGYHRIPETSRAIEAELMETLLHSGVDASAVESERVDEKLLLCVYLKTYLRGTEKPIRKAVELVTGRRYRVLKTEQTEDGAICCLEPQPKWRVVMRVSQSALEAGDNGDSYGTRNRSGGRSLFALSDGMGSGTRAADESRAAIRTLFRLYDSGMEKDLICDHVNRMLMAEGREDMYATLDAVSVDLNRGTAELLKFGTPPSYLLRKSTMYSLSGEALPCGILDDARPSVIPITFEPGDMLFLCTDGVTDALSDRLESVLLCSAEQKNCAEHILKAAQRTGQRDDLSVMVLKVSQ